MEQDNKVKKTKLAKSSQKVKIRKKENNHDYEQNAILIHEAYKDLYTRLNRVPKIFEIAEETKLTRQTIMNHRKDFDKIWREVLLPKYKTEFSGHVMQNIINSTSKNAGSQKLAMQIFKIIEEDSLKDGLTINVNLPDFLKDK